MMDRLKVLANEAAISFKKKRLKSIYLKWVREVDRYSCGLELARNMNPRISEFEGKMLEIAKELRELGEKVPPVPGEKEKVG
jgi:hypothetical protein